MNHSQSSTQDAAPSPIPRWMITVALTGALMAGVLTAGGCRLCADCDLDSYPSYGGAWQRTVRDSGRVGSLFDPGGSRSADLSARIDAETAEQNIRNRSAGADSAKKDADSKSDDPNSNNSGSSKNPGPLEDEMKPSEAEDAERLKQMEDRLRGLELQDINYRGPAQSGGDWR